jgi:hypothetical protein
VLLLVEGRIAPRTGEVLAIRDHFVEAVSAVNDTTKTNMRQRSSAAVKSQTDVGFAGVANVLIAPLENDETLRNNC